MQLYSLKFTPISKYIIWGGDKLKTKYLIIILSPVLLFFVTLLLSFDTIPLNNASDFEVRINNEDIIVKDINSDIVVYESDNASKSLQFALDKISSVGGSITINSGTYFLDKPLKLFSNVTFKGRGKSTKLVVSEKNEEGIGIICKEQQMVEISDITLSAGNNKKAKTGIIIDNSGNVSIHNVFAVAF
jgi:hypothetical protein